MDLTRQRSAQRAWGNRLANTLAVAREYLAKQLSWRSTQILDQVYSGVTEETRRLQIEKLPSLGDAGNPTENVTDIRSHRKSNKAG